MLPAGPNMRQLVSSTWLIGTVQAIPCLELPGRFPLADFATITACPSVQDDMQDRHQNSRNLKILMLVARLQILNFLTATGTGPREKLQLLIGSGKLLSGPRIPFLGTCFLPGALESLGSFSLEVPDSVSFSLFSVSPMVTGDEPPLPVCVPALPWLSVYQGGPLEEEIPELLELAFNLRKRA